MWLAGSGCHRRVMQPKKDVVYSESAGTTTYTEAPYGALVIPGKWDAGKYTKTSRHQYFYRADTSTLVAAIGPCKSLPFGKEHLEGHDVVKRYYDLEKSYQEMQGQTTNLLLNESGYMLWRAHIDGIDQYFLFGEKDGADNECVYRYLNLKTRKMNNEACVQFLKDIFINSK